MKSIVSTLGPPHDKPWWWKHIHVDPRECQLDYERLVYHNWHSQQVSTARIPFVMLKVLRQLLKWRRERYSYVFTIECDLVGLSIAFWQSMTGMRRPRHVIVQFIMREKQQTLPSRVKYGLMSFMFRSVYRVVVSSRAELDYYHKVFNWPTRKLVFVPVLTNPELLERKAMDEGAFYLAAGRTYRDYATLLKAVAGTSLSVLIVGGRGAVREYAGHGENVRVMENITVGELEALMERARAIVVPLQDRAISTGQSVVLQAMALGKAVIATRTAGTEDYIDDMKDGILVAPGDDRQLRDALLRLEDPGFRRQLGDRARSRIVATNLPRHYADSIRRAIAPWSEGARPVMDPPG